MYYILLSNFRERRRGIGHPVGNDCQRKIERSVKDTYTFVHSYISEINFTLCLL